MMYLFPEAKLKFVHVNFALIYRAIRYSKKVIRFWSPDCQPYFCFRSEGHGDHSGLPLPDFGHGPVPERDLHRRSRSSHGQRAWDCHRREAEQPLFLTNLFRLLQYLFSTYFSFLFKIRK